MQNQLNQSSQFTQSELQQLKSILSKKITYMEKCAMLYHWEGVGYKEQSMVDRKNKCFSESASYNNKAKKLAKLQKKVKNLISGKESS
jgi:hypothetical protein